MLAADLDPIPGVSSRLAIADAAGQKLSEARGRRGERVALRNVLVPPGTAQLFLIASAGLRLERRAALRPARQRRAAQGGRRGGAQRRRRARPGVTDGTVQGYLARGDVDVFRYAVAAPVC